MRTFPRKGWGRIFILGVDLEKTRKVPMTASEIVMDVMKLMDPNEFDYLPKDFILPHGKLDPTRDMTKDLIYTHKFDSLDLDALTFLCAERGVYIACVESVRDPNYPDTI